MHARLEVGSRSGCQCVSLGVIIPGVYSKHVPPRAGDGDGRRREAMPEVRAGHPEDRRMRPYDMQKACRMRVIERNTHAVCVHVCPCVGQEMCPCLCSYMCPDLCPDMCVPTLGQHCVCVCVRVRVMCVP